MPAGYSGTPLPKKLGFKDGFTIVAVGAPADYQELLGPLPVVGFAGEVSPDTDIVHLFVTRRADMESALIRYRAVLKPSAAVWVSWPKKSSGVASDIGEGTIREVALPMGWVDIKVCAVSEMWSGLKLVVRKELRPL
jgi:hypothetical protein